MYLYVIVDESNDLCKIGYSEDPDRRCAELNVGNPYQLRVEHRVRVDDSRVRLLERKLHFELGPWRCRGEWFRVTPRRASGMLDYAVIRWHDDPLLE